MQVTLLPRLPRNALRKVFAKFLSESVHDLLLGFLNISFAEASYGVPPVYLQRISRMTFSTDSPGTSHNRCSSSRYFV